MKALRLTIHLDEPLLMTGVANSEPNSSATLDYVPGSALRGACVAAYLRAHPVLTDLAADGQARALFFSEQVRFLNGYPAHPNKAGRRALPCPLSWVAHKDTLDLNNPQVWDLAVQPDVTEAKPKGDPSKLKGVGRFFWQADEETLPLFAPPQQVTVHNASNDPALKRPETSTVFRYVALAAGQAFIAYVISENETLLETVRSYLPDGPLYLGGSQMAGYGRATVTVATQFEIWDEDEGETQMPEELGEGLVLTLLSDALLRTPEGHPSTDFHATLCAALNRPTLPEPRAFSKAILVGGFNRKWGLPLPQQWAVARGSTFVYDAAALPLTALQPLLLSGMGERRNEGFGRIGVNLNARPTFATYKPASTASSAGVLSTGSKALARQMARRRLLAAVRAEIPTYTGKIRFSEQPPRNTQLSRVRQWVRDGQRQGNLASVTQRLTELRKTARAQFESRLDAPGEGKLTWRAWLDARASQLDALALLDLKPEAPQSRIAGESAAADGAQLAQLKLEATALLMDAVLRKASKTQGE